MYSGRCDPLSCVLRRVGVELFLYICCVYHTGLICKACSLGLVHFTGEILSVSSQKFYSFGSSHFSHPRRPIGVAKICDLDGHEREEAHFYALMDCPKVLCLQ